MKQVSLAVAVTLLAANVYAADINFSGTDLGAAIAAANAGDRIIIDTNGPLAIEDISIDFDLTLQAGTGFTPVLEVALDTDADEDAGIEVDGATVNLIGLSFTDAGNTTDVDMLEADNAAVLNITNCTFTDAAHHTVIIKDDAVVNIQGSTITGSGNDQIRGENGTLTINDSTLDGGDRNVQWDAGNGEPTLSFSMTLTNSRFLNAAEEAIIVDDNSASGETTGNVLIIDSCDIIGFGNADGEDGILLGDGDLEFTTLEITNNHINPGAGGGQAFKADKDWGTDNTSTLTISNNLLWADGLDISGLQIETFGGVANITDNTIFNFGEGGIVLDRDTPPYIGTFNITNNLVISWDESLYVAGIENIGAAIADEFGLGAGVNATNNVLLDASGTNFAVGFSLDVSNTTGTDPLTAVSSITPTDANFLARTGSAGSSLSGTTDVSDWAQF